MARRSAVTAWVLGGTAGMMGFVVAQTGPPQPEPALKPYQVASDVTGDARSIGSETLNNLMAFWVKSFTKFYPNVSIQIEGKGSETAVSALALGTAQFGPMSRAMTLDERDRFKSKFGYPPTPVRTAVDALGVFVNKDNPLTSLSLDQVDAIYSKARRRGIQKEIVTWGDAGLTGEWADKPIRIFGRYSSSGTYGFFKEVVLQDGDFRDRVEELPGAASVVQAVGAERYAIGYGGIGYATSNVRAIPLVEKPGAPPKAASAENASSGTYPLTRFLYVYVNRAPGKPVDPLVREFIRMICSKEGQEDVVKDGFYPLPAGIALEERKKVE